MQEHFATEVDFRNHQAKHKEYTRKRLICTELAPFSKTKICAKQFENRRDFTKHVDEHLEVFRTKTITG